MLKQTGVKRLISIFLLVFNGFFIKDIDFFILIW